MADERITGAEPPACREPDDRRRPPARRGVRDSGRKGLVTFTRSRVHQVKPG
ncbi:hypothetical protein GCM10023238_16660 [Streptomyces heliomycini]